MKPAEVHLLPPFRPLKYLGEKEYADYVKDNRISIANFLEETELVVEKNLVIKVGMK
ncbi:hypothetical protein [Paenibacillus sp. TC-CSREp1]|uniref:hypothetical protein n=1 Tax=Paenibacillus sp. TC-CSREp1 TaxID=3410089 RepID=UPI003CF31F74